MAADPAPDAPKGGKLKIIILIVVGILIAVGVSVAATLYFVAGGEEKKAADEGDAKEAVAAPAVPVAYFEIDNPFLVTLNGTDRQRYLQVFITFSARQVGVLDAVQLHLPLLKNKLQLLLSRQDPAVVKTDEGRQALQAAALEGVNEVLSKEGAGAIEQVLFTNLVMQ